MLLLGLVAGIYYSVSILSRLGIVVVVAQIGINDAEVEVALLCSEDTISAWRMVCVKWDYFVHE